MLFPLLPHCQCQLCLPPPPHHSPRPQSPCLYLLVLPLHSLILPLQWDLEVVSTHPSPPLQLSSHKPPSPPQPSRRHSSHHPPSPIRLFPSPQLSHKCPPSSRLPPTYQLCSPHPCTANLRAPLWPIRVTHIVWNATATRRERALMTSRHWIRSCGHSSWTWALVHPLPSLMSHPTPWLPQVSLAPPLQLPVAPLVAPLSLPLVYPSTPPVSLRALQ